MHPSNLTIEIVQGWNTQLLTSKVLLNIPPYIDAVILDPPFKINSCYNKLTDDQIHEDVYEATWGLGTRDMYTAVQKYIINIPECPVTRYIQFIKPYRDQDRCLYFYLVDMAIRIHYIYLLMKSTATLFLYCDQTLCAHLKILLDWIFGSNYRNMIINKRQSVHNNTKSLGAQYDTILQYSRTANYTWNRLYLPHDETPSRWTRTSDGRYMQVVPISAPGPSTKSSGEPWVDPHSGLPIDPRYDLRTKPAHWSISEKAQKEYERRTGQPLPKDMKSRLSELNKAGLIHWRFQKNPRILARKYERMMNVPLPDDSEKRKAALHAVNLDKFHILELRVVVDNVHGTPLTNFWDIPNDRASEIILPETQKPVALKKRLIEMVTNPGDLVYDAYCGSGSTAIAAYELGRHFEGHEVSYDLVKKSRNRVNDFVEKEAKKEQKPFVPICGITSKDMPTDLQSAYDIARWSPPGESNKGRLQIEAYVAQMTGGTRFKALNHEGADIVVPLYARGNPRRELFPVYIQVAAATESSLRSKMMQSMTWRRHENQGLDGKEDDVNGKARFLLFCLFKDMYAPKMREIVESCPDKYRQVDALGVLRFEASRFQILFIDDIVEGKDINTLVKLPGIIQRIPYNEDPRVMVEIQENNAKAAESLPQELSL